MIREKNVAKNLNEKNTRKTDKNVVLFTSLHDLTLKKGSRKQELYIQAKYDSFSFFR